MIANQQSGNRKSRRDFIKTSGVLAAGSSFLKKENYLFDRLQERYFGKNRTKLVTPKQFILDK